MARRRLAREFGHNLAGVTIQPTVLADDTFMRLIRQRQHFDTSGHFFAIASQEMRRVLIDYTRQRKAAKRGGGGLRLTLDPGVPARDSASDIDCETLDAALGKLTQLDQRKADVVQYRILWGLTIAETSKALGIGHATIERDWAFAKVWLAKELEAMGC